MNSTRWLAEPVTDPIRRRIGHYRSFFEDLIHAVKNELAGRLDEVDETLEVVSGTVRNVSDQLAVQASAIHALGAEVERLQNRLDSLSAAQLETLAAAPLSAIDAPAAAFLNRAAAWNGPLSEVGLFINHPYLVEWRPGGASVRLVNERIIEQPFVFSAVADLVPGSRILDVGGGESIVALALASLGYRTTVIEPRGYPFEHPNLTVFAGPLESFESDEPFDAVISLSTIEHFGLGHYADGTVLDDGANLAAMERLARLTGPGGRLVLTAPYGRAEVTELQRVYDREGVLRLLDGWKIDIVALGHEVDERTWVLDATELTDPSGAKQVVMLVARLNG